MFQQRKIYSTDYFNLNIPFVQQIDTVFTQAYSDPSQCHMEIHVAYGDITHTYLFTKL